MGLYDNIDFSPYVHSPEELAHQILQVYFNKKNKNFPIDPFSLMSEVGIAYQFRNFDKLEGVYIVPDDKDDLPIVGINNNRPITRQRFTAAHEICHHIKDRKSINCPANGRKNQIEKFADSFAAELLMPIDEFRTISDRYLTNGYVDFDNIIRIADYFGVSFRACTFRLAYKLGRIDGNIEHTELSKRINSFKPEKKRVRLGIQKHELPLLRNMINQHAYFITTESQIVWNKFKFNFLFNENRIEGIPIGYQEICEIVTDLHMKKQDSVFCKSEFEPIIEVAGHSSLYDYISVTAENISIFKLTRLHQILFQYSPFPDASGKTRNINNVVLDSKFETSDHTQIIPKMVALEPSVQKLISEKYTIPVTEYIDVSVRIHHELTQIHPFTDGNGRVTRAFLNWLFIIRKLPPVYIKYENKFKYLDALSTADQTGNYEKLFEIFYKEILRSMIELNSKFQ